MFYLWMVLTVSSSDIRHVGQSLNRSCAASSNITPAPAGAGCNPVPVPSEYPHGDACFGVRRLLQKMDPCERHAEDVIQSTGRFSGLPRIWWNRKQYFMWACPITANRREVGGSKRLWQWSSPNTETDRKKNHATTQILPMEEGQDGKACSANEKNACKLTSQLHWRQRHKKL